MSPGDVGAAASKASKAESLLGKAGTFSKSIAVSGIENAKNIIKLPKMALNNLGSKLTDLRTVFNEGKGVVGNFTKSVVVSGAKNAKSLLTKVKGTLSDVGTVSGAFAKAFGKTYVKECSKYANTCFSMSRAAGAGLEAGYKGFVAGVKEAKSVLKVVKGISNPNAKEIISERVNGLDLNEHQLTNKQLSSKKMSEIKSKIDNRTATKSEYEAYNWNKKFSARRREGVKQFWNQERERIINGKSTTRNWTPEQIHDILNGKTPKYEGRPIQGHHSYSASKYPHLADKGEIIYPVTPNEHLSGWHGGNFKNSNPGEPIIDINDF